MEKTDKPYANRETHVLVNDVTNCRLFVRRHLDADIGNYRKAKRIPGRGIRSLAA